MNPIGMFAGNAVNSIINRAFPGLGGQMLGGVAKGLVGFVSGDLFSAFNGAMQAFGGIAGGIGNLLGGSGIGGALGGGRFPMMPGMNSGIMGGIGMGLPGRVTTSNPQLQSAASALSQMQGLRGRMKNIMNSNMSPEQKQMAMMELQQQMQLVQQMLQMLSNISKQQHSTAMAIIGNMR